MVTPRSLVESYQRFIPKACFSVGKLYYPEDEDSRLLRKVSYLPTRLHGDVSSLTCWGEEKLVLW
jgi:hypothetical protein